MDASLETLVTAAYVFACSLSIPRSGPRGKATDEELIALAVARALHFTGREAIIAEWRSASTRENAIETARLIQGLPGKKVLLTSDFHMYRALRVFRKVGIDATPMAVPDMLHSTEHWNGRFQAFETMLAESAKIVYYALRGWI